MGRGYGGGARFERSLRVTGAGAADMGGGYGGGARFERSLGVTGAGAAEMAWEEATEGGARFEAEMAWEEAMEGERGLSGR